MIGCWPVTTPLFERLRIVECPWTLFKQWQVMQWLENVLFPTITARVTSQQGSPVQDLEIERICLHHYRACGTIDRNGIAIGLKGGLTVRGESDRGDLAAVILKRRKGLKERALTLPHLSDRAWLSRDTALVIFETLLQQAMIEVLKRNGLWDGNEKIPAAEAYLI